MNPLAEICAVAKKYPDVVLIVDSVSSFSAVPIPMDELGIDVLLTGSQKALALPPGFSLFSVSEKGFARAEKQKDRGYYFDFLEFKKNQEDDMTPTTPSIGHIHALESKLDDIFAEGLTNRYERHTRTNALVHDWVRHRGFDFFAQDGYRSKTLTCVKTLAASTFPNSPATSAKNITSSSTPATARSKAKPSASPTWATKPKKRLRIC